MAANPKPSHWGSYYMKNSPVASRPMWLIRHAMTLLTIGIVVVYALFIQWIWGWQSIFTLWDGAGWGTAALAIALLLLTYVLRTWRIYDYFPKETGGRFGVLLRLVQVHNLLNIMLPFRTGEASFPLLMKREFDLPLARTTAALFVMRLFDLHALLAAAGTGLALQHGHLWAWALWLVFLVAPAIAFATRRSAIRLARKALPGKLTKLMDEVELGLPADAGAFARAWGATLVNWFTKVAVLAWVLGLLGDLSIAASFGGSSAASFPPSCRSMRRAVSAPIRPASRQRARLRRGHRRTGPLRARPGGRQHALAGDHLLADRHSPVASGGEGEGWGVRWRLRAAQASSSPRCSAIGRKSLSRCSN